MTGINGRPGRSRDLDSPFTPDTRDVELCAPPNWIYLYVCTVPKLTCAYSLFRPAALRILIGRTAVIFIHSCFNTGSISRFFFIIAMFVSEDRFF